MDNVVVDVGTGYYVKKVSLGPPLNAIRRPCKCDAPGSRRLAEHESLFASIDRPSVARFCGMSQKADTALQTRTEAKTFYTTKTTFIQSNLETLQKTIERKQENAQTVVQVLQMKLQEGRSGAPAATAA